MIFPGMDPYLENEFMWEGVRKFFVVFICEQIQPQLKPRYFGAIEERVFAGQNETETSEIYLEIRDRFKKQKLVTVIEVVSFTNKYAGPGRESYLSKQREIRESQAHLVEIDLLRAGQHVLAVPERFARQSADYRYLICVNRAGETRDEYDLYPKKIQDPLPRFGVPLASGDPDVVLDLQAALQRVFDAGAYAERLEYDKPCPSKLSPEEKTFVRKTLRQAGIKSR